MTFARDPESCVPGLGFRRSRPAVSFFRCPGFLVWYDSSCRPRCLAAGKTVCFRHAHPCDREEDHSPGPAGSPSLRLKSFLSAPLTRPPAGPALTLLTLTLTSPLTSLGLSLSDAVTFFRGFLVLLSFLSTHRSQG